MTSVKHADDSSDVPGGTGATTLDRLGVGQAGRVLSIGGDRSESGRRLVERLGALGLRPGTDIRPLRRAPLGDPVIYRVCDFDLCLRRDQAVLVTVSTETVATAPSAPVR